VRAAVTARDRATRFSSRAPPKATFFFFGRSSHLALRKLEFRTPPRKVLGG
jgi:hypothetical protein